MVICHATRHDNQYFHNGEFLSCHFIRIVNSTTPQGVILFQNCRRPTTCQSTVKTGALVIYEHGFLLFSVISDSDSPILLPLLSCFADKIEKSVIASRFSPIHLVMTTLGGVNGTVCNVQQYQQSLQPSNSRSPSISCLTRGESIGLAVSIWLIGLLLVKVRLKDSSNLQLSAEASLISSASIIVIFIWIGVRSISFHVSVLFDEMLHSGTYDGIGRRSQRVTGSCSRALLTSTWSA
jgi:hypothetical protein